MKEVGGEETRVHTRLLKCALEVEDARAYWEHTNGEANVNPKHVNPKQAFDAYWFGAKSMSRVEVLLTNMRARFDAFPSALRTLRRWPAMSPDARRVICHWHLQLADPLYRAFTGDHLVRRRLGARAEITRDLVVNWVGTQGPDRWTMPTKIQFASKLLSASLSAGLVGSNRDPRPLVFPRIEDDALAYLLYLLREVPIDGTLLVSPYVASVGLAGSVLEDRLRGLSSLTFKRQGDLVDFAWKYPTLDGWADAAFSGRETRHEGGEA